MALTRSKQIPGEVVEQKSIEKKQTRRAEKKQTEKKTVQNSAQLKTTQKRPAKNDPPQKPADADVEDIEDLAAKKLKWQPKNWNEILDGVRQMRAARDAPVDTMGCHLCADAAADPKLQRFQILVSLMLSAQTKDEVNFKACARLREFGFSPDQLKVADETEIGKVIYPVGFYKTKAKHIKQVASICADQYDGDIPHSVEALCKLPGVGPKMAFLAMNCAWNETVGIGVDTHLHRIVQRWNWLPKGKTKSPEDTRQQLESWVPQDLWRELNWLLVGFGQTICAPVNPKCADCLVNKICPSAFKKKK